MESVSKFKERTMHSNYRLALPALCTLALLSGLLPVPAAAEVVTVKEFYDHFGSGEPHRQSITIDLINAVVSETSIAACGGDDRQDSRRALRGNRALPRSHPVRSDSRVPTAVL